MVDSAKKPTVFKFDLSEGSSPPIIGLDLLQHAQINNNEHWLSFKRLSDKSERQFSTYIAKDASSNIRVRLLLLSHYNITSNSLLGLTFGGKESHVAKKLHRVTHVSKQDMKDLLCDAGVENKRPFDRCNDVHESCDICASFGWPSSKVKISLKHVN